MKPSVSPLPVAAVVSAQAQAGGGSSFPHETVDLTTSRCSGAFSLFKVGKQTTNLNSHD